MKVLSSSFLVASAAVIALLASGTPALASVEAEQPTGRYIVRTTSDAATERSAEAADVAESAITEVYSTAVDGYAAALTDAQVDELEQRTDVIAVVRDQLISVDTTQASAPWGLDRLDQSGNQRDGLYSYDTTGAGVTVFVIDSGVRLSHAEFGGRASSGWDFVDSDSDASDCNGHGTHVAGTIAGSRYGVAKDARIVSLRAMNCSGSGLTSWMIGALDWAVAHKPAGPAVVNISAAGPGLALLDSVVARTAAAGIPVVVAAGNENQNACSLSPARSAAAITVGAVDQDDRRAYFSNFGGCVAIFAPGVAITAASNQSDGSAQTMSGTSMATPHVTGVVARYLQTNRTATAAEAKSHLFAASTAGAVADAAGSANRLAFAEAPLPVPAAQPVPAPAAPAVLAAPTPVASDEVAPAPTPAPAVSVPSAPEQPVPDVSTPSTPAPAAQIPLPSEQPTPTVITAPSTPARPSVVPMGGTRLRVFWMTPSTAATITKYELRIFRGSKLVSTRSYERNVTSVIVNGASAGSTYRVAVRAKNSAGWSSMSAPGRLTMVTPAKQAAPTVKAKGSTALAVRWHAPKSLGGPAVTRYQVRVYRGSTLVRSVLVDDSLRVVTVAQLKSDTTYRVSVRAANGVGFSPPSKKTATSTR